MKKINKKNIKKIIKFSDFIVNKIILDIVKLKCNEVGRKSRLSDSHFLDVFMRFCKDYTKWKCLDECIFSQYTHDNYIRCPTSALTLLLIMKSNYV